MDTGTHAIMGGSLYALTAKLILFIASVHCPVLIWSLFAWGLIEGAWPDAYPYIWYKLYGGDRWLGWYWRYHHQVETTAWRWFPAFRLHVSIVDPPFHEETGNWFPKMWRTCVWYWIADLLFLYLMIFI